MISNKAVIKNAMGVFGDNIIKNKKDIATKVVKYAGVGALGSGASAIINGGDISESMKNGAIYGGMAGGIRYGARTGFIGKKGMKKTPMFYKDKSGSYKSSMVESAKIFNANTAVAGKSVSKSLRNMASNASFAKKTVLRNDK